jgi:hypothetical protein
MEVHRVARAMANDWRTTRREPPLLDRQKRGWRPAFSALQVNDSKFSCTWACAETGRLCAETSERQSTADAALLLCGGRLAPVDDPGVKRLRRDVGAVRPGDRPQLRIEFDTAEVRRIGKRLEDAAPSPTGQIDLSFRTIFEREAEAVVIDHFDLRYVHDLGHVLMLRQRLDALQRQAIAGALPVFLEGGPVKRRPLENQS